jgi:hypothetical protein
MEWFNLQTALSALRFQQYFEGLKDFGDQVLRQAQKSQPEIVETVKSGSVLFPWKATSVCDEIKGGVEKGDTERIREWLRNSHDVEAEVVD